MLRQAFRFHAEVIGDQRFFVGQGDDGLPRILGDAASAPAVASRFAGHKSPTQRKQDLNEDWWELGQFAEPDAATYESVDGLAVLYCLS